MVAKYKAGSDDAIHVARRRFISYFQYTRPSQLSSRYTFPTPTPRPLVRSPSSPFPNLQIPVEWIIDICDEENGWFIGTAYAYMEKVGDNGKVQGFLHVVVPDQR